MLAELYALKQSLETSGQGISLTHSNFLSPPGLTSLGTLIAKIDGHGNLTELRLPLEGEIPGLWTLRNGNFKYFPAVRPKNPIFNLMPDDSRRESFLSKSNAKVVDPVFWSSLLEELETDSEVRVNIQDFTDLFQEQGNRIIGWQNDSSENLVRLKEFVLAFQKFSMDPAKTGRLLLEAVKRHCLDNPSRDLLATFALLLVGRRKETKGKEPKIESGVQIIFDFSDPFSVAFTIHDRDMHQAVLRSLAGESTPSIDEDSEHEMETAGCAFHSATSRLLAKPFGGFAINPVINKEQAPYSKKGGADVPCNNRYHRAGADGFPIGEELSRSLVGAMKSITAVEHKDRTWRVLRNGRLEEKGGKKRESNDILISFPSFETSAEISPVAPFGKRFSASDDDDEASAVVAETRLKARRKSAFGQAAEPVCLAFEEKLSRYPDGNLTILLTRQISPGQIQLAYSSRISIQHFVGAIRRWEATEGNVPASLRIPMAFKGADGFRRVFPALLFPEDVTSLLTHQWIRNGSESARVNAPPVGLILDIFLQRLPEESEAVLIENLLELLLQRSQVLLIHGGAFLRADPTGSQGIWSNFTTAPGTSNDPKWALLKAVSLTGTLLHLLKSSKENYMNEPAYLTGFLLACADELHIQYHHANSKGKLPSSLMGNSLLMRAAESPASAVADLMERSRIYLGWAKTAETHHVSEELKADKSEDARKEKRTLYAAQNARKAVKQLEEIAPKLLEFYSSGLAPKELSVSEKAQMFLGYLTPMPRNLHAGANPGDTSHANEDSNVQ